jgi:hypothetical protein
MHDHQSAASDNSRQSDPNDSRGTSGTPAADRRLVRELSGVWRLLAGHRMTLSGIIIPILLALLCLLLWLARADRQLIGPNGPIILSSLWRPDEGYCLYRLASGRRD